jgi:hypothetical protein
MEKAKNKQVCHQNISLILYSHAFIMFYLLLFLSHFTPSFCTHSVRMKNFTAERQSLAGINDDPVIRQKQSLLKRRYSVL